MNHGENSNIQGPKIKMPGKSKCWPSFDSHYPQNLQKEQPIIGGQMTTSGGRYTVVTIINDTIQKVQVDSGSFLNVMSNNLTLK